MGFELNKYGYEAEVFSKKERILDHIAKKGCSWAQDIVRGTLIPFEDTNRILMELLFDKTIQLVQPFERFVPPPIIMTRINELQVEAANDLQPENWAKRNFFYFTDEGLEKWIIRNQGKGRRCHNIYIDMYSLILGALIDPGRPSNSQVTPSSNAETG